MAAHEPVCVGFKVCAKCGEAKRALAFQASSENRDGLCGCCRECRLKTQKKSPSAIHIKELAAAKRAARLRMDMEFRSHGCGTVV